MKKLFIILLACMMICSFSLAVYADGIIGNIDITDEPITSPDDTVDYVENQIVLLTNYYVDLSEYEGVGPFEFNGVYITDIKPLFRETTQEEINRRVEKMGSLFSYRITIAPVIEIDDALDIFFNNSNIICAEPNYITVCDEPDELSNNMGMRSSVTITDFLEKLEMSDVWNYGFDECDFTVAVIDTGFEEHIDLEKNLNMDLAFDAHNLNSIVNDYANGNSHGNMCVGIIGAYDDISNAGIGICKSVNIMPIQCFGNVGSVDNKIAHYESICTGVEEAIYYGAKVINISQKLFRSSREGGGTLQAIIEANDAIVVTSAGNEGVDMANSESTNGKRNDSGNMIVVGSVDANNIIAGTSNWSTRYCDLFAYGVNINSTAVNHSYATDSGTSFAAPQVTAACALLWSKATHLDAADIRQLIIDTVTAETALSSKCVSGGVLNIKNAVLALYNEDRSQYGSYTKGDINNSGTITSQDYLLAKRIYNGTYSATAAQRNAADIDGDGVVEISDYTAIQNYYYKTYYFPPV